MKKLVERVHEGLLSLLAAEDPKLARESGDSRELASRLVDWVDAEVSGGALPGQHDAELDYRARLLVSIADLEIKGKTQRVVRIVQAYHRALVVAIEAARGEK